MRGGQNPAKPATLAARLAFGAVVLLATLSPWRFEADAALVLENLERATRPSLGARDAVDGLRNLALFAGWGTVWFVTAPSARAWRVVAAATASGTALSLTIEALQLLSPVRTASLLDLLSNSVGALGGALVTALAIAITRRGRGERSFVGIPGFLFAGPYLAAALLEAFVPLFRQGMLPGARGGPLERLRLALAYLPAAPVLDLPWTELALFLPAGALLVAALAERGLRYRIAGALAALAGGVLVLLVELARGMAGMPIEPGAMLAHGAGLALGAAAAALSLPWFTARFRGAARPAMLFTLYAMVLGLWSWRPLLLETDLAAILVQFAPERFIPLHSHAVRMELFSVVHIGIPFLLYLPLGALLAVWPLRARGSWRALLPAVYLAVLIETGQILIAGRYFDITDVLVQTAGAAVGWIVVRKAGFRPYGEVLGMVPAARPPAGPCGARGEHANCTPP